jgi:uncharacterized protein with PIN domain
MRFLADGMLGKLTRWLRILGHDVEYTGSMNDQELIKKAKKERRILLTRDVELFKQAAAKGAAAYLIENPNQTANLASLAKRFKFRLEVDAKASRCPKCNGKIYATSKSRILKTIPAATSSNYDEFWQCQNCGQIYWHGTHWQKIDTALYEARKALLEQSHKSMSQS